jgi:hypothetical protein
VLYGGDAAYESIIACCVGFEGAGVMNGTGTICPCSGVRGGASFHSWFQINLQ